MILQSIRVGPIKTNCYIIVDDNTKECGIIDPGDEFESINSELKDLGVTPKYILITHGHYDHIMAVKQLRDEYGAEVICHEDAKEYMESSEANVSKYHGYNIEVTPTKTVKEGDMLKVGDLDIKVLNVPGHANGSACYYIESESVVFTGDTLFRETIGITHLPNGSYENLTTNIKEKLFTLPEDTIVYPGHGASTSIGHEKKNNGYVR